MHEIASAGRNHRFWVIAFLLWQRVRCSIRGAVGRKNPPAHFAGVLIKDFQLSRISRIQRPSPDISWQWQKTRQWLLFCCLQFEANRKIANDHELLIRQRQSVLGLGTPSNMFDEICENWEKYHLFHNSSLSTVIHHLQKSTTEVHGNVAEIDTLLLKNVRCSHCAQFRSFLEHACVSSFFFCPFLQISTTRFCTIFGADLPKVGCIV